MSKMAWHLIRYACHYFRFYDFIKIHVITNFRQISGFKRWWNNCWILLFQTVLMSLVHEMNAHQYTKTCVQCVLRHGTYMNEYYSYTQKHYHCSSKMTTKTPYIILVMRLKIVTNKRMWLSRENVRQYVALNAAGCSVSSWWQSKWEQWAFYVHVACSFLIAWIDGDFFFFLSLYCSEEKRYMCCFYATSEAWIQCKYRLLVVPKSHIINLMKIIKMSFLLSVGRIIFIAIYFCFLRLYSDTV